MTSKDLLIPAAIVAAGAMIGAGLFFGLRGQQAAPPVPAERAAAPPPATVPLETVRQQAAAALQAQRPAVAAKCWPTDAATGAAKPLHYLFNFTFGADGTQIMRGVEEIDRQSEHAETVANITPCVQGALAPIRIPPPGAASYVEVPFETP